MYNVLQTQSQHTCSINTHSHMSSVLSSTNTQS